MTSNEPGRGEPRAIAAELTAEAQEWGVVAIEDLGRARWSERIPDDVFRNNVADRPDRLPRRSSPQYGHSVGSHRRPSHRFKKPPYTALDVLTALERSAYT